MDKNSKNWDEIKEIEVVSAKEIKKVPANISFSYPMPPQKPREPSSLSFDVFLDDEIGTEKITL